MPVTDGSGVPIHYDLAGSGPPLVLLHGFVGDSTSWRHAGYVDVLASQFTLVLVDGRGRGRSGKPHDPAMYATQHLAADVLAVLDDLGADRAGFWGHSLGGRVGLLLAIRHPDRLRALIVGATRAQAATVDPAIIEAEVRSIREHGWPGVLEQLQRIQVPTLMLAGDQDPGLADLRATADRIPGARSTVLPDCGHLDTFTRSDLTLPVVLPFLTETLVETPT
jgi:pimeloyl-ACP methyl ester carboxylesterase